MIRQSATIRYFIRILKHDLSRLKVKALIKYIIITPQIERTAIFRAEKKQNRGRQDSNLRT